jgi:hypothetical protein
MLMDVHGVSRRNMKKQLVCGGRKTLQDDSCERLCLLQ